MASKEEIEQFVASGGVLATLPLWKDIPHRTIQEYYPDKGSGFALTLAAIEDKAHPGNWIAQYVEPFGGNWDPNAKKLLKQIEFEYDPNPRHQYLYARNLSCVKIGREPDDNWEMVKFLIAKAMGGQLIVWVNWEREKEKGDVEEYATGYSWPDCP